MTVDLTDTTLGQDGQIIITGEDGQGMQFSIKLMTKFNGNDFVKCLISTEIPITDQNIILFKISLSVQSQFVLELNQICCLFRLSGVCEWNDNSSVIIIRISIDGCQYPADSHKWRWDIVYNADAGTKIRSPTFD